MIVAAMERLIAAIRDYRRSQTVRNTNRLNDAITHAEEVMLRVKQQMRLFEDE